MRTTTSISLLAALGLLSLSTATAAQAAPAKIGVKAAVGGVTVKVSNPNRYAIKGSVTLLSGSKAIAGRKASVKPKGSKSIGLGTRGAKTVTVVTSFGKAGARPKVVRTTVKLPSSSTGTPQAGGLGSSSIGGSGSGSAGAPSTGQPSGGNPTNPGNGGGGNPGTNPPPPVVNPHFTGTITGSGEQFGFTVKNGIVDLDGTLSIPVTCKETSGAQTEATSSETFDPIAGWALGDADSKQESHPRNNGFSGSAPRSVTYKLVTNQTGANAISGSLSQSFLASLKVGSSGYQYRYWNCYGAQQFTAVRDK